MVRSMGFALALAAIAAFGAAAVAEDNLKPTVAIKDHRFDPAEIHVPAGKRIALTVANQDATPEEIESHGLKVEKVIPGGSSVVVRFGPLDAGRYPFYGEFHKATAQGVVIAE
jgi:plastocyanin